MRSYKFVSLLFIVAAGAAALPLAVSASPADSPQAQANLLQNGSFESFSGGVATGWATWVNTAPGGCGASTPTYQQASTSIDARRVKDGTSAQQFLASSTDPGASFQGGLQQTVNGLTAGKTYRFTIWAQAWSSTGDNPALSEGTGAINFKIGIVNGSTFAADPNIKWSDFAHFKDTYGQQSVELTAAGGTMTVFTYANPSSCARHTEVFWDAASLTEAGAAPTAAPAQPTATPLTIPTNFPTPTANAEGKIIYTVRPGDSIIHICEVIGRGSDVTCIDDIKKMNGLSGNTLTVGQQLIIGTTTGAPVRPTATAAPTEAPTAAPGTTTTAGPQATAGPATTASPTLPPAATQAGAGAASICVTLYNDANGNGVLDAGEGLVAGGAFALLDLGASTTVATYTTDGASEPRCFENLPSGNYRVTSTPPQGYKATTRSDWDLTLAEGSTANLEFGAQSTGSSGGGSAGQESENTSRLTRALLAAAGVVLLLIAAGVAGFLVLTRRR